MLARHIDQVPRLLFAIVTVLWKAECLAIHDTVLLTQGCAKNSSMGHEFLSLDHAPVLKIGCTISAPLFQSRRKAYSSALIAILAHASASLSAS